MHLEGKIAAAHCVKEIEADGKLSAEASMNRIA
jgi:hypothetical protein